MKKIAKKYNLSLDGAWNQELLPHQGRHPNEYHQFVLNQMKAADQIASQVPRGQIKKTFLQEFGVQLKAPIRNYPDLLRKTGWI